MITATKLSAADVGIDNKDISQNAIKVVRDLQQAGFKAYLVGGCVRDLILKLKPKDFDVVSDATPEQIKSVISNSRIIGRRFKLVHVRFGYEVIEVATFRGSAEDRNAVSRNEMSESDDGQLLRDNIYGEIEEDVVRRDFKANALYYDPVEGEVLDFVDGLSDIQNKKLCSIGDPTQRFREDPVRMLRVIRFASKLNFSMEDEALQMIEQEGKLLSNVSSARLFDEVLKLFHGGAAYDTYVLLRKYGLFKYLFPFTDQCVVEGVEGMPEKALKNTDKRIQNGKPVIPAFLFACMMWDPVKADAQILMSDGTPENEAWRIAMNDGLRDQNQYVAVPRRLAEIILDIWNIHFRLIKRNPRMVKSCLNNRRFRAAYDFLLLRNSLHEVDQELIDWWTRIQEVDADVKAQMIDEISRTYKSNRSRRHSDGERNGNSIDYNASDQNFNQKRAHNGGGRSGQNKPRNNKRRSNKNGQSAQNQSNRRGSTGYRAKGRKKSSNKRRRANPAQSEDRYMDERPKDDYGVHQTEGNMSKEKKVKVRRKRRIVMPDNNKTPHF